VITRANVMEVVESIADRGAFRAADKTLTLVRSIFNWACGTGRLERNPTLGLKKRNASRPKTRVLSADEIRIFLRSGENMKGMSVAIRDALRLQLLTGLRVSEVTEASRSEIDFSEKLWIVPAYRTKSNREHVLPLSDFALGILRQAYDRADEDARRRAKRHGTTLQEPTLLFASKAGISPLSPPRKPLKWQRRVPDALDPHAASRSLIRCRTKFQEAGIKLAFNTHDLRRTLSTHLGDMGVSDEVIEQILNHAPTSVAGKHYNHAKRLQQMRLALDWWAGRIQDILSSEPIQTNVLRYRERSLA
jgi:integrase